MRSSVGLATKDKNVLHVYMLDAIYEGGLIFFVKIPFIKEHLFYKHFVRQLVSQATKDVNVDFYTVIKDRALILYFKCSSDL